MSIKHRSEAITWTAGGTKNIPLDFLPTRGPTGGRLVVESLRLKAKLTVTTGVGVTCTGANLAKSAKRIRIYDAEGDRLNWTGPELRASNFAELGRRTPKDPADIAASATGAERTFEHMVLFGYKMARRGIDFGCPADVLHAGGGIEVSMPTESDLGFTGGNPTSVSGTYEVVAYCREEFDLQSHVRTERRSVKSTSRTDLYIPVHGGLLRRCFLFKAADHATGGADLSSITDVTAEALSLSQIETAAVKRDQLLQGDHDEASTADPYVNTRALTIVGPAVDGKIPEMVRHPGQILLRLAGCTVDDIDICYEVVTGRTARSQQAEIAHLASRGVSSVETVIKTAGKTSRDLSFWKRRGLHVFMPAKIRAR